MKIVAFCGRRGAGKTTLAGHVRANASHGWFPRRPEPDGGWSISVKGYSMAGALKSFAVDVLGLPDPLVRGSDEDKAAYTGYRWEDLPHWPLIRDNCRLEGALEPFGFMTVRQVLQEFGTGVVRRMNPKAWHQACLRVIAGESFDVATIDDLRFEDEVKAVLGAKGIVIGLTRALHADSHTSERSVGDCLALCTTVLDNAHMTLEESKVELEKVLLPMTGGAGVEPK